MDVAEDVVFGAGFGNGHVEVSASKSVVQIAVCRAVGDQEVDVFRKGNGRFQVWPCRDTVELDSVKFQSFVLQTDNAVRKQSSCPCRILVEDTVVVTGDEDPELSRNGCVPVEEIVQVGRIEALASISRTDKDVSIGGY